MLGVIENYSNARIKGLFSLRDNTYSVKMIFYKVKNIHQLDQQQ